MAGCHFFITLQFGHIYFVYMGKVMFLYVLVLQSLLFSFQSSVLKHCIICIFLIHFDSVPTMLTVLFKLVWNIQKRCKDNFLSTKPRHFFLLKMMNNITRSLNIVAILTKNKDQKQLSKKLFLILVVSFCQNCSCLSFWWYC